MSVVKPDLVAQREQRTVLNTITLLFKSRRFLVLVIALVIFGLAAVLPSEFAFVRDNVGTLLTVALFVVAGYSVEDAIREWRRGTPVSLSDTLREIFEEVLNTVVKPEDEVPPTT